ncbi:hypothetical protein ABIE26_004830, partial [Pedobacter africanus]|nr:hypothetical protein [Pedobacter africanus]
MFLQTDEQTIEDLGIFGKQNSGGIFDLYNAAHTRGGEEVLKTLFRHPLSDQVAINQRSSIISHFADMKAVFPFDSSSFDAAERYLLNNSGRSKDTSSHSTVLNEKEMHNGVTAIIGILWRTREFINSPAVNAIAAYRDEREAIAMLLADAAFEPALKEKPQAKLPYPAITAYDVLFRVREHEKIKKLFAHIYTLDVYLSVAEVAVKRNFVFPTALEKGLNILNLSGVYHP